MNFNDLPQGNPPQPVDTAPPTPEDAEAAQQAAAPVQAPVAPAPLAPLHTPAAPKAATPDPLTSLLNAPPVLEQKESRTTGGSTITEQTKVRPEDVENLGKSYDNLINANTKKLQAEAGVQDTYAVALQDAADKAKAKADELATDRGVNQIAIRKRLESLDAMTQDLQKSENIDPNRLMANQSTFGKIAAGLGVALGGLAMTYGAKDNIGLNIINNAIQRDVEAQKASYENKYRRLQAAQYGYSQYRELLHDDEAARLAEMNRQYDIALKQADAVKARVPDDVLTARVETFKAELQKQQAENNLKINAIMTKNESTDKTLSEKELKTGKPNIETALKINELSAPEGFKGMAKSAQEAKDFREAKAAYDSSMSAIQQLKNFDPTTSRFSMSTRAKADSIASQLKGSLRKQLVGGGQVTAKEWEILERTVPNPTDFLSNPIKSKAALQQLEESITQKLNDHAKAVGFTPRGSGGSGAFNRSKSK